VVLSTTLATTTRAHHVVSSALASQTGERGRKFAKKFAMLITTLQLTQMVFGIAVTVSSVVYHAQGRVCYVSLVNSGFGLAMYVSYFCLFLQVRHATAFDCAAFL
jgi:hypothetical protein